MANITKNPFVLDTFSADVVIGSGVTWVSSITFKSAAAGDLCVFIDSDGDQCFHISQNINAGTVVWSPAKPFKFPKGLTLDVSACTGIGCGDIVTVFVE